MFPQKTPIGTVLTKEHIESITIEQLHKYHNQTFIKNNIRVFVTGNIESISNFEFLLSNQDSCRQQTEETYSYTFSGSHSSGLTLETREDALQSSFILCKKNIGYTHEDRRNFKVLTVLYGGYFGSRLMQKLREEKGYTYGIFCGNLYYENESIFYIEADVMVDKTKAAIQACFREMKRLHNELVCGEELTLLKSYMLGELLREVDGSVSYQKKYAYWNDFYLDENEMQQLMNTIQTITPETIQTLAKKYLVPESFATIVVGKMK
jgi:predicted Zn-dependent peptidase